MSSGRPAPNTGSGCERVNDTWTHAIARWMVRPLIGTPVRPNHITILRLITGLIACAMIATGLRAEMVWGGVVWVFSAFLDRADGELARIADLKSRGGHLFDYCADVAVNALFFLAAGLGLRHGWLGGWAVAFGVLGCLSMTAVLVLSELYEELSGPGVRAYGGAWGFHPDDALYLMGPFIWLKWLAPILVAGSLGATLMTVIVACRYVALRRRIGRASPA